MGTLTGKTAVVTGASSGIGRAITLRLGEAGAHVFAAGRRAEALEDTIAAVAKGGGTATAVSVDLRNPSAVEDLISQAVAGAAGQAPVSLGRPGGFAGAGSAARPGPRRRYTGQAGL